MKKSVFFLWLLLFSQISAAQRTILWKVTDTVHHKTSVLLGTFHLFGNSFVDSIPEIESYLSQSELAVFESVDKVDHIRNMINSRESSTEIRKKLKKKDLEKLLKISEDWKVDIYKLRPVELGWKLEQVFIRSGCGTVKEGDTWDHFDMYLQHLAEKHKLRLVGLETGKQQLRFIERENKFPGWKEERRRISYLLDQINSTDPDQRNCELANRYRKFDLDYKFDEKCGDNILIKERNDIWMRILPDLLKTNNCFVAVGLFHLYRECGLLQQLKKAGFVVEPITMVQKTK